MLESYPVIFTLGVSLLNLIYGFIIIFIFENYRDDKIDDILIKLPLKIFPQILLQSIFEELVWRLPLISNNLLLCIPSMIVIAFFGLTELFLCLYSKYIKDTELKKYIKDYKYIHFVPYIILSPLIVFVPYILLRYTIYDNIINNIFIGCSVASFAIYHLYNYEKIKHCTVILTLLTHGGFGLSLSYLALRFGLRYSILSHLFHNGILLIIVFVEKLYFKLFYSINQE